MQENGKKYQNKNSIIHAFEGKLYLQAITNDTKLQNHFHHTKLLLMHNK